MRVDSRLIQSERMRRAWSQSHLAAVAGLGLRTVQRIESTGSASFESAAAIAAAFSVEISVLEENDEAARPESRADASDWIPTVRTATQLTVAIAIVAGLVYGSAWILGDSLPPSTSIAAFVAWALLVFLAGIALSAIYLIFREPQRSGRLPKEVCTLASVYAAAVLLGGAFGGVAPNEQPSSFDSALTSRQDRVEFTRVESLPQLDQMLAVARMERQPVLIEFTADWCVACKAMAARTFADAAVKFTLEPFILLRVDITENSDEDRALLADLGVLGAATMKFFDRSGQSLEPYHLYGFVSADEFREHARMVASI